MTVMMKDILPNGEVRIETCTAHGDFQARHLFRDTWSRCPQCNAEKAAEEAAKKEMAERQLAAERWQKRLGHSGIPERFRDRTLDTFRATTPQQQHALDFASNYATGFADVLEVGRCAAFLGRVGTGKTHLSAGIGLHVMEEGYTVVFSTVARALRRVKETWSKSATETESQAIGVFTKVDLLILDEVGVQFGSDAEKLILFDILNERYQNRQPTILLSNLDIKGVSLFLGERVMDRLREDGGEIVVFDWESHRRMPTPDRTEGAAA